VRHIKLILLLFCTTFLAACATSKVSIESQPPGAEVIVRLNDSTLKKIGITPLNIDESQITNSGDAFELIIEKTKFTRQSFFVGSSKFSRNIKIMADLTPLAQEGSSSLSSSDLDEVSKITAQTHSYIKSKDFFMAEKTVATGITKYPGVSTFYVLLGNSQYMQKNLDKALNAYKKAAELDPKNGETDQMIRKIESMRGSPGGDQ
jgi:TolA-binding protein